MLDIALKNILRQRTRTILTILGIVIGIASVVALSSFGEGINQFIQGSLELSAGKIIVQGKGSGGFASGFSGSEITQEQLNMLASLDGVKDVSPINLYIEGGGGGFGGFPQLVVAGIQFDKSQYLVGENIKFSEGRGLAEGDSGVMVIGKSLADEKDWSVGDFVTVKSTDFEIIGVLELTNNQNVDGSAIISIDDMKDLLDTDTYQTVYAIPFDVKDSEKIADEINTADDTLSAITSTDYARQASQIVDQIRIFTFGLGGIAAVVGGLGVLNTMIMAVLERRREIGVMKAIGATNSMILQQILTESSMISVIGGFIGLLLGGLASAVLVVLTKGGIPATVTPLLAAGSMAFALLLGIVGGLYPAMQAAKLDPVVALRYE
jgi:putative ABC transport system permease protein